jgi:hypothetical protein
MMWLKRGDVVLVNSTLGDSKKAKINWVKDDKAGVSYIGKGELGTSNVVKVSDLTLVKESRGFKHNDIVKAPEGKARVNWVEDGSVGITYLSPPEVKGAASVVKELELYLISASAKDEMADRIASITDDELARNILEIRRRRMPQPTATRRRTSKSRVMREKKISMDDIFKKMEENPKSK